MGQEGQLNHHRLINLILSHLTSILIPSPTPTHQPSIHTHNRNPKMGNICGKEEQDPSPPGRVLGSAPPAKRKSTIPPKVGGPARTLGGETTTDVGDARRKAAEAAEVCLLNPINRPGKGKTNTISRLEQKHPAREASCKHNYPRRRDSREAIHSSKLVLTSSGGEKLRIIMRPRLIIRVLYGSA